MVAADFQWVPGKWRNIRRIRSHIILCIHIPTVISRLNGSFWLNIDYCCNERKNNKEENLRDEIRVIRNSRTIFKTPLVNTAERIFDLSAEFTYTNARLESSGSSGRHQCQIRVRRNWEQPLCIMNCSDDTRTVVITETHKPRSRKIRYLYD